MASMCSESLVDVRETELDAITAIFPELVRFDRYGARLSIPVALASPVKIRRNVQPVVSVMKSLHDMLSFQKAQQDNLNTEYTTHSVHNLPDMTLSIQLPDDYPLHKPPQINISTNIPWVPESKIRKLIDDMHLMWETAGHDQIVYVLISHLQEEAERCFDLAVEGHLQAPPELVESLLQYDLLIEKEKFDDETFTCGICLDPKKGRVCHRLQRCGHVFCVLCLNDFYNSSILEGDIDKVRCLDPDCDKNGRCLKLRPAELLQIGIPEDRVQRYMRLRRKRKFESKSDTVYCPREWCQGPSRIASDPDGEISDSDESDTSSRKEQEIEGYDVGADGRNKSDTATFDRSTKATNNKVVQRAPGDCLAICMDCSFAFCLICKRSWHGEFGYCSVRNKRIFTREERASERYLKRYTTPCPSCHARAQKTMGCNHMICRQCATHFCYLCSSWLPAANPYKHFNTAGSPCYQKLWELEQGDGVGAPARPGPPPVEVVFENSSEDENDDQEQGPLYTAMPNAPRRPDPLQRPQNLHQRARQRADPRPRQAIAPPNDGVGGELRGHGLHRFLQLAARDEEDAWDFDELEDQFIQLVLIDQ